MYMVVYRYTPQKEGKKLKVSVRNPTVSATVHLCKKDVQPKEEEIVGYIVCKNKGVALENVNEAALQLVSEKETYFRIPVRKKRCAFIRGWLPVEEGYVGVLSYRPLIVILAILIMLAFLFLVSLRNTTVSSEIREVADTVTTIVGSSEGNDSIEYAGYDVITVQEGSCAYLKNPEYNDVWFTYSVIRTDTGEVILPETGLIEPGTYYPWDIRSSLETGEYSVSLLIRTFNMEDQSIEYSPVSLENVTIKIM